MSAVCTLDLAYNALREKLGEGGLGVAKAVAACLAGENGGIKQY